jgi:tetratricopeptide (TPR) repeat protein
MNARLRIAALALLLAAQAGAPALAQYANEFTEAKLLHQGTTTHEIAGSGTVVVQVQVNADGSHKVTKVLHSSNAGDNAAAMEIAQNSTYRPAHRGTTPVTSFYDFTFKFNGKSLASTPTESSGSGVPSGGVSPAAAQVAALIRQNQYQAAVSKAQSELLSAPGDDSLREMLGLAAYHAGDYPTAAAAFARVDSIGPQFRPAAADALATAAVKEAQSNPTQALAYAQKAVALAPGANSHYALGVVQLDANDPASAVQSLRAARDAAMADPKIPMNSKVNIDSMLLQAYLANHDTANAQAIAAQIKQLDPNSTAGARAIAAGMIKSGEAAVDAKDYTTAIGDFDQAAAAGDPDMAVTANTQAALAVSQTPKPDYKRMQAYAEKALAINPNDALANFALGFAFTGQWASSHDDATKSKATAALAKADQEAKAEGNETLALQIETFVKKNFNTSGGQSGGGS